MRPKAHSTLAALAIGLSLSACASSMDMMGSSQQTPTSPLAAMSCEQLTAEAKGIATRLAALSGVTPESPMLPGAPMPAMARGGSPLPVVPAAVMPAMPPGSIMMVWPTTATMNANPNAGTDLARIKTDFEALDKAVRERQCTDVKFSHRVGAIQPPPPPPAPIATPAKKKKA